MVTVEEETGIYRGEVLDIMGALADLRSDVADILELLGEEEDGQEEETDT